MKVELKKTLDGSPTLFVPALNEHYHSVNGAVSEAVHVFIKNGLDFIRSQRIKPVRILEAGMGTGLNVCLTFHHAHELHIDYTAIEPYPLDESVWKTLNYDEWINRKIFEAVHEAEWERSHPLTGFHPVILKKLKTTLRDFHTEEKFDLIYYDAFAPNVQPELWSTEIFAKIYGMMNDGGALVTYCAKGSVKRALKTVGFKVESLPGAVGKREMTRAHKI